MDICLEQDGSNAIIAVSEEHITGGIRNDIQSGDFNGTNVNRLNCAHNVQCENITIIERKVEYEAVK